MSLEQVFACLSARPLTSLPLCFQVLSIFYDCQGCARSMTPNIAQSTPFRHPGRPRFRRHHAKLHRARPKFGRNWGHADRSRADFGRSLSNNAHNWSNSDTDRKASVGPIDFGPSSIDVGWN